MLVYRLNNLSIGGMPIRSLCIVIFTLNYDEANDYLSLHLAKLSFLVSVSKWNQQAFSWQNKSLSPLIYHSKIGPRVAEPAFEFQLAKRQLIAQKCQ